MKKTYVRVPGRQHVGRLERLGRALVGAALSPTYWALAHCYRGPGLQFRTDCALLGLRLLYGRKAPVSYADIYRLLFRPIESVRYFEFDFMWRALSRTSIRHYLDVSSPRLFPVILTLKKRELLAELVNPDPSDLTTTANLVKALGLEKRCNLHGCLISAAPLEPGSFDVVTSISVVEHIPQDTQAIQKMWEFLKPGGRLLLTVMCAALAEQEYVDMDFFGLQTPDETGFFFHQYIYDQSLLEERFYSVTGPPAQVAIYGEREAGTLLSGLLRKWSGQRYPHWREPYTMAREFRRYESLFDLPGKGVIGMEFVKK